MKLMLSAFAGAMLLGAAFSTPAEARCWWNGWSWACSPRYYGYYGGYYRPWWGHHRWHRHYWHRHYWHRRYW
jgi:hypothetical protein